MKKIVQITNVLMRMRPESELDIVVNPPRQKVVRETSIPREFLLQDLCEKRRFRRLARKLTAFLTFLVIYLLALTLDRDITERTLYVSLQCLGVFDAFHKPCFASCRWMASLAGSIVRRTISTALLDTSHAASGITFAAINDVDSFWDWFANSLLTSVYSTSTSDGRPRSARELYTIGSRSSILAGFQVMQRRYLVVNTTSLEHKHELCYSGSEHMKHQICFSSKSDSTDAFGTIAANASEDELDMFQYTINSDLKGGFQTYFLYSTTNGAAEFAKVKLMQAFTWIDEQTRSVEITIPMYNINLKKASIAQLTVEFSLAGGVTTSSQIQVMNVEPYNLNFSGNVVRVVYEALYVLHVAYFTAGEAWVFFILCHGRVHKYIARSGLIDAISELSTIMTNVGIIVARWLAITESTQLQRKLLTSPNEYVSIISLADGDDAFVVINILNVMILTGRALKYFQVTDGGRRLLNSIYNAMPDIMSFLPIYATVLIGYTFMGQLLYGLTFSEWSTLSKSFCRVFEMNFGLYDPGPIYDAGGILGGIYVCSATVIFCIIMLNVFMAIVMATWDNLTEKEVEKVKVREKYRAEMTFRELMGLILLRESILDTLIGVVAKLESHETISKEVFEESWRHDQKLVPSWLRECILRWYWNSDDTPPVGPTKDPSTHEGDNPRTTDFKKADPSSENRGRVGPCSELLHTKESSNEILQQRGRYFAARVVPTDHNPAQ